MRGEGASKKNVNIRIFFSFFLSKNLIDFLEVKHLKVL